MPSASPVATVTPVGPVRVRVGEPINLECQASGEPRPSVSWHRLDSNRKTMLSSPVPMESNAVMQVLAHLFTLEQFTLSVTTYPVSLSQFKVSASKLVFEINLVLFCFKTVCIEMFFSLTQILVARPEDSGMYVCTARNNEGTTETKVEVIIEGGSQVPSVPRASVPEPLMVVVEGQTTTLRCEAHGKHHCTRECKTIHTNNL